MSMTTTDDPEATEVTERCGQCGAAAAPDQRYCLNCGFHRRNAPDPVSRYLSEAIAARSQVAAAQVAAAARRGQMRRLSARTVALLVALALLIGVLIGNTTAGSSTAPAPQKTTTTKKHGSTVKNATGSSYLQQEENLPDSVTP
jgi:hypothetical protein